ncbi:MAG: 4-hydroxy-tetrahydrodipicolinate reductase [Gemmatimonadota bacterium]
MTTLSLTVSGATGRMGRAVARLAAGMDGLRVVGGIARGTGSDGALASGYERVEAVESAGPVIEAADAIIDFSAPEQIDRILREHADALAGRALIVGTTGLDPATHERLDRAAEHGPVVVAANFSIGVNLLEALVEEAARRLPAERYDVEIVEAHHRRKADSPSGTALALGRALAAARDDSLDRRRRDGRSGRIGERPRGEIGLHAVRGGDVTGEHRVLFLGDRERIELAHAAHDRSLFAEGALVAARWAAGRDAGRYGMRDVLGL